MNQIFNFSRFVKLVSFNLNIHKKRYLLMVGGVFAALFLFQLVILLSNPRWNNMDWAGLFVGTGIVGAIFYFGKSFPYLRKKETTIDALMVPASVFEKYLLEIVSRFVLYLIAFPVIFYLASHLSATFATILKEDISYTGFMLASVFDKVPKDAFPILAWVFAFGASIVFAGAASIRKYPLIKTIVLVGAIFMLVVGYFYVVIEVLDLKQGLQYISEGMIGSKETALTLVTLFLAGSSLITLVYAFFKLKEREIA